jgi:hypothetical protein
MAPEVALGRQYNNSVDTYSFAVIIWQVLRSRVPFREMGKKMYVQEVVLGGKRPPLDRRWPAGFSALLQRCWHDNKELRPSFTEVLADINLLLHEARGLGSASVRMKVRHKLRYAKSYMSYVLGGAVRYRPLVLVALVGVLAGGCVLTTLGGLEGGSALLVVACAGLYLVLLTYVQGPNVRLSVRGQDHPTLTPSTSGHSTPANQSHSDGSLLHDRDARRMVGGAGKDHHNLLGNLFSRGRKRAPSVGLIGLERSPHGTNGTDPFACIAPGVATVTPAYVHHHTSTAPVPARAPGLGPPAVQDRGHFPISFDEVKLSLKGGDLGPYAPAFNPLSPHEPEDEDVTGATVSL